MKSTKIIDFIRCTLYFFIGSSWAILLLGGLFLISEFSIVLSWWALFFGILPGAILLIIFHTILYIFELNVKLRNH